MVHLSTEVTTVSYDLLTDRTLWLREDENVSAVLLSGLCRVALAKYNVTVKEMECVCYAICPWRPLTELEKVILQYMKEFGKRIVAKRLVRKSIMGIAYSLIFVLGTTGIECLYLSVFKKLTI